MSRRVVVTGIGLVTPLGQRYADNLGRRLSGGRSGVGPITRLRCQRPGCHASPARSKTSTPRQYIDRKEVRRNDRFVHLAVAASRQALDRCGVRHHRRVRRRRGRHHRLGHRWPAPPATSSSNCSSSAGQTASAHSSSPCSSPTSPLASSRCRSAHAAPTSPPSRPAPPAPTPSARRAEIIRRGDADGDDRGRQRVRHYARWAWRPSPTCTRSRAATTTPQHASRPFDAERDGFVMGEGAGVLMLEDEEHARKRGARIYAEMIGYATTADAYHITEPAPGGAGPGARHAPRAGRDASIAPEEVRLHQRARHLARVFNDRNETAAHQDGLRRACQEAGGQLHQVDDRPHAGRGGRHRGGRHGADAAARHPAADDQLRASRPDCDLDYVPNEAREAKVQRRDLELDGLRRPQRRAGAAPLSWASAVTVGTLA